MTINLHKNPSQPTATALRITGALRTLLFEAFAAGDTIEQAYTKARAAGHTINYNAVARFRQCLGLAIDLLQHELADTAAQVRGHMVLHSGAEVRP